MTKYRWMGKSGRLLTHAKEYDFRDLDGHWASFTDDTLTTHQWTVKTMLRDGWEMVSDSPIRTETVTTRRIEPGVYGLLQVAEGARPKTVYVYTHKSATAPELREMARVALELAEYLEHVD